MKKIILSSLFIFNLGVLADNLVCMGNTNAGELIQLNVDLNKRLGKVTIENATYLAKYNRWPSLYQQLKQVRRIFNSYCRKCISQRAKTASC